MCIGNLILWNICTISIFRVYSYTTSICDKLWTHCKIITKVWFLLKRKRTDFYRFTINSVFLISSANLSFRLIHIIVWVLIMVWSILFMFVIGRIHNILAMPILFPCFIVNNYMPLNLIINNLIRIKKYVWCVVISALHIYRSNE